MIEKIGYPGDGGLGILGQGNFYPLLVPELPKPGHKPVIGDKSYNPSGSSKKVNP